MVPTRGGRRAGVRPLLGTGAAGAPIEAVASSETIAVPEDIVAARDTYALRVRGNSMIDEQIRDGDIVILEDRKSADNGEMVIALLDGADVTLKKFYRDDGRIRLQPANPALRPLVVEPDQVQIQGVVVGVVRRY
ncbi:MAG: repressor LexA [Acidobacteria bacterium]|nr:repressor LexA [Acidobacteriota bacterium]